MNMTPTDQRNLTIHQMRVFLRVAEAGSFSRAAIMTGVTQSALSRMAAQIEQTLGAPLFDRSGRGVSLTENGCRLRQVSTEILRLHDGLRDEMQELRGVLRGECRVAMPVSVGRILFVPLIQLMRELHPHCSVRVMEAFSADIPAMLQSGQADTAVVTDTHGHYGVEITLFATEDFYLIGPPDAEILSEPKVCLRDVVTVPLLLTALSRSIRESLDAALERAGLTPEIKLEVDSNEGLMDLVRAHYGFTILTFSAVHREVNAGEFRASMIVEPSIHRRLYQAFPVNRPISLVAREIGRQLLILAGKLQGQARWTTELMRR